MTDVELARWAFLDTATGDWIEVKPGTVHGPLSCPAALLRDAEPRTPTTDESPWPRAWRRPRATVVKDIRAIEAEARAELDVDGIDARRFTRWFLMQDREKQAAWMRSVAPNLSDLTGWEPDHD
jgi:hypothetical protein